MDARMSNARRLKGIAMLANIMPDHFNWRRSCALVGGLLAMSVATEAGAQSSTNCIVMTGGLVHCDTMPGYDVAAAQRANAEAGAQIGSAIRVMRERSLRAKIGKMAAGGDCQGAIAYALTKGRYDLASEVRNACQR
jgi:hypothetical protein